jgi:hypothetical protein
MHSYLLSPFVYYRDSSPAPGPYIREINENQPYHRGFLVEPQAVKSIRPLNGECLLGFWQCHRASQFPSWSHFSSGGKA